MKTTRSKIKQTRWGRALLAMVAGLLSVGHESQGQADEVRESLAYRFEGRVESPEINVPTKIDAGVVLMPDAVLVHQPPRDAYKDPSRAAIRFLTGSGGGVRGGVIDANGSYAGIFVQQRARNIVLEQVEVRNAAYKGIHIMSDAEVRNCTASSIIDGSDGRYRPTSLLVDPGSKQAKRVIVENFTHGLFKGTAEGQMIKLAATDYVRLTNIQTPVIDDDTVYSLSLAENLKTVIVTDSTLPRRVAHFPDPRGEPSVNLLVFSGVTFNNDKDPTRFIHDHLNARVVIYHNCTFLSVQQQVVVDETPKKNIQLRAFTNCTFETDRANAVLIGHAEGDELLAGKVIHSRCTFIARGEGGFKLPADWADSGVELEEEIDVEGLIDWIEN